MNTLVIAVASIVLSVAAQFFLKAGMMSTEIKEALSLPFTARTVLAVFANKLILGGFLLYGLGALIWLRVLSSWDVSKAYPLVGAGFVLTLVVGLALGEQVTIQRAAGVIVICVGIWMIATG